MKKIFTVVLLLGLLQVAVSRRRVRKNDNVCPNPVPAKNFNPHWLEKQSKDGFYIEYGHPNALKYYANVLLDREVTNNEDYSEMCCRVKLFLQQGSNPPVITGSKHGYGGKQTDFTCSIAKKYPVAFQCKYLNEELGRLEYQYPSLVEENFIVEVHCNPNGERGWVTVSTSPLTNSELKKVLDHVESIGFNRKQITRLFDNTMCLDSSK